MALAVRQCMMNVNDGLERIPSGCSPELRHMGLGSL